MKGDCQQAQFSALVPSPTSHSNSDLGSREALGRLSGGSRDEVGEPGLSGRRLGLGSRDEVGELGFILGAGSRLSGRSRGDGLFCSAGFMLSQLSRGARV